MKLKVKNLRLTFNSFCKCGLQANVLNLQELNKTCCLSLTCLATGKSKQKCDDIF